MPAIGQIVPPQTHVIGWATVAVWDVKTTEQCFDSATEAQCLHFLGK